MSGGIGVGGDSYIGGKANIASKLQVIGGEMTFEKVTGITMTAGSFVNVRCLSVASDTGISVNAYISGVYEDDIPDNGIVQYSFVNNDGALPEPSGIYGTSDSTESTGVVSTSNVYYSVNSSRQLEAQVVKASGSGTKNFYLQIKNTSTNTPSTSWQAYLEIYGSFSDCS